MYLKIYIYKKKIIKKLSFGTTKIDGRNKGGQIVLYHRGHSLKKKYILIDFNKYIYNVTGIILRIEYDSKRTALVNLVSYFNGILCYSLSIKNLKVGDTIHFKNRNYLMLGCTNFLNNIKPGYFICLLELYYKCGAQYIRAAGSFAKVIIKKSSYCIIKLKSKQLLKLNIFNIATLGIISGLDFRFIRYKKASFFLLRGWTPIVRGVAMNPIDHPHGGGGGKVSVSPWGKVTKGPKTKNKKKFNNFHKNIIGYLS
jgi:large subunit ribosomal protein L2